MTMCEGGCIRRTNIELDEDLVQEAFKLKGLEARQELVHLALKEFVENRGRRDVRELRGKVLRLHLKGAQRSRRGSESSLRCPRN